MEEGILKVTTIAFPAKGLELGMIAEKQHSSPGLFISLLRSKRYVDF